MANVSTLHPMVNGAATQDGPNAPISRVITWAEGQADKGDMGGASARLRLTSLRQMAELVAPDEPKTAQAVLDNIERLRDRWATKNLDAKSETAKTYASRAKTTLEEYLRWAEAPAKYDPKRTPTRTERKPKQEAVSDKTETPQQSLPMVSVPQSQMHSMPGSNETRNFPLGDGRGAIHFVLPPGGVTFDDVKKFAVHLFTLATDFNISDADQARVFAMVVRGE